MIGLFGDKTYVTDVLVKQLFYVRNTKRKIIFWNCFGDVVFNNLKSNLKNNTIMCENCGKRVERKSNNQTMCESCYNIYRKNYKLIKERERRYNIRGQSEKSR